MCESLILLTLDKLEVGIGEYLSQQSKPSWKYLSTKYSSAKR